MKGLSIILDLDDTIVNFHNGFENHFSVDWNSLTDSQITQMVNGLKKNFKFWTSLPVLRTINFIPAAYCTARINSKYSTKTWLKLNNFPDRPIYQVYGYGISKVPQLKRIPTDEKGEYKVLIDDSLRNVEDAINHGIPALLIDTPYNRTKNVPYRIMDLSYKTIRNAYRRLYF